MAQQQLAKQEESLGDLFSELAKQTGTLVRQEVTLAQVEITRKATAAGKQLAFLVVGGAVAYAALLILLTAVIVLLANVIPLSASALIVAAVAGIAAYFLITTAISELKNMNWTPDESVESIKEDAEWLKDQVT